jgi:hypothetical protein
MNLASTPAWAFGASFVAAFAGSFAMSRALSILSTESESRYPAATR